MTHAIGYTGHPPRRRHANAQDVSEHTCARSLPARSFFFPFHRYMSEHICARPCPVRSFILPLLISCEHSGREQAQMCSFPSCAFFLFPLSSLHKHPGHERAHLCPPLSCALVYPSPLDLMRT